MISNKLKSMKLLVTIWAMALLTYIVVADKVEFISLGNVLSAAPLAYCVCNVAQKKIYNSSEKE